MFIIRVIRGHLVLLKLDGFLRAFIVTQTDYEVKVYFVPFNCFEKVTKKETND